MERPPLPLERAASVGTDLPGKRRRPEAVPVLKAGYGNLSTWVTIPGLGKRDMGTGLWRDGHWVQVSYEDIETVPISRRLYQERGYLPRFDDLPTKEEYDHRAAPSG
jgi:hypothetical protein